MKLTDEQLMDILKEAVKAIALKYNSIVEDNEKQFSGVRPAQEESNKVTPIKELPNKEEKAPVHTENAKKEGLVKEEPKSDIMTRQMPVDGRPVNATVEPPSPQVTREVLDAMSYNELKVLAKENGVKAIGSKVALIDKILDAQMSSIDPKTPYTKEEVEEMTQDTPQEEEEETVENPQEDTQMEEVEDYEEESIDDEDDEEEDNLYTRLVRETMDMTDEEIADLLAEVGASPKGKRQALLTKLEKAVRDGLISLDDDEEDEEAPVEEDQEVVEDTTVEDGQIEIAGSEERVLKVEDIYGKYLDEYEEGNISDKEVVSFLKDYYNNSDKYQQLVANSTKEELAEHYALIHAQLVDDDGEEYDFGEPYVVEGEYWCSGQRMQILEDGILFDEITGEQFELED